MLFHLFLPAEGCQTRYRTIPIVIVHTLRTQIQMPQKKSRSPATSDREEIRQEEIKKIYGCEM